MKRCFHTNRRLHLLMENSREIILLFRKSGEIVDSNKQAGKTLGYEDDIFDVTIADIFKRAAKIKNKSLIINSKFINKFNQTIAYKKNQTCFPVELKIIIFNNFNGMMGLCIASDISEKQKLNKTISHMKIKINELNEIKNKFIANISHELKTPVNGIMGMAASLQETELTPQQQEYVDVINQCCRNMNSLINDLLDMTRMKYNKLVLEERKFNFRQMIDNIVKLNKKSISDKNLKLVVNISKDIPDYLIGDENRLTQIINNLLSNAIKFTFEGRIALDVFITEFNNEEIELFFMVIDTGIGISLEDKDKIFQSFYQADGSITRRFGGFGLGLSICQMLVKAMGGKITVESELGKGSTFLFTVKLKVPEIENEINTGNFNEAVIYGDFNETLRKEELNESNITEDVYNKDIRHTDKLSDNNDMLYIPYENKSEELSGHNLKLMMEKLILSIEMKGWMNAEQLAISIRDMIREDKSLANKALQLLLVIRREDYDLSIQRAKELMKLIREVYE